MSAPSLVAAVLVALVAQDPAPAPGPDPVRSPDPTDLARLHDLVVPDPAPLWPPAPGWLWLLAAVGLGALALGLRTLSRWQRSRYRREALARLEHLHAAAARPDGRAEALAGIAELLKRTALTAFPRAEVASLTGPAWSAFLDRVGGTRLAEDLGPALQAVTHDPRRAGEWDAGRVDALVAQARTWIRGHRGPGPESEPGSGRRPAGREAVR